MIGLYRKWIGFVLEICSGMCIIGKRKMDLQREVLENGEKMVAR